MYKRLFVIVGAFILFVSSFTIRTSSSALAAPLATNTPTRTATPNRTALLVVHLTWQGRPAQPNTLNQLPVTLTLQLGSTVVTYANQTTDANGTFTVPVTTLANGTYTWWAKGPTFLASAGTVSLTGAASTALDLGVQRTGDVNNDNIVDILDSSLMRSSFGRACGDGSYNGNADFSGDCVVDSVDFSLLRSNFGSSGAPAITPPSATSTAVPTNTPTATATNSPTRTATNTALPTNTTGPTPNATVRPGLPCVVLPADNVWNRNISALPVHANSANYMTTIGLTATLHPDFASGTWNGGPIGIPFITVPGNQPRVPMSFTYANESEPGPYPVPTNAPIQGGPNSTGDRHVIVVDQSACVAYELFKSYPNADGSWRADAGAVWPLSSNALRPNGWTSADAAGLPLLPGLVGYDEVASGVIRHAIRFTSETISTSRVWPARHSDGQTSDPNAPPMGLRLRLKASVNISSYAAPVRVVLQALKDYGMILADTGTSLDIGGIPDSRWNDSVMHSLEDFHGTDFEAVDESGLMVDPNSGQAR